MLILIKWKNENNQCIYPTQEDRKEQSDLKKRWGEDSLDTQSECVKLENI